MFASHWIVEDILKAAEEKNIKELERLCKKYAKRYPNDFEIHEINKDVKEYLKRKNDRKLREIKSKLKSLVDARKLESSGGTGLWFGDTRRKGEQEVR
jgi:16S rRNA C967 or C1407 C5-methylase (RsmB/RsmF family)